MHQCPHMLTSFPFDTKLIISVILGVREKRVREVESSRGRKNGAKKVGET